MTKRASAPCDVKLEARNGVPVISIRGELDLSAIGPLERALLDGISSSAHTVVDLSGCTFIDAAAIGVIIRAQRLLRTRIGANPELRLVVREPNVTRTLMRVGIEEVTTLHSTLEGAVGPAPVPS